MYNFKNEYENTTGNKTGNVNLQNISIFPNNNCKTFEYAYDKALRVTKSDFTGIDAHAEPEAKSRQLSRHDFGGEEPWLKAELVNDDSADRKTTYVESFAS